MLEWDVVGEVEMMGLEPLRLMVQYQSSVARYGSRPACAAHVDAARERELDIARSPSWMGTGSMTSGRSCRRSHSARSRATCLPRVGLWKSRLDTTMVQACSSGISQTKINLRFSCGTEVGRL